MLRLLTVTLRQRHPAIRRLLSDIPAIAKSEPAALVDPTAPGVDTDFASHAIMPKIVDTLRKNGISSFFPIQAATFSHIMSGKSIIAKAQTGTGKTLAFLIPIVERVLKSPSGYGKRLPRALIVCPTRELATQVFREIPKVSPGIASVCVHGGVSYSPQTDALNRGVDVVVGTPGRLIDLIKNGHLSLSDIDTLVLDESDHMLDIGFKEEVQDIFKSIREHKEGSADEEKKKYQTLLFSATVPQWVRGLQNEYIGKDSLFIDLVGDKATQANVNIQYLAVPSLESCRTEVLIDLLRVHGAGHKSLVFADTRTAADKIANELFGFSISAAALHGGISQNSRDQILTDFRRGGIDCLVATDVAARGIDIPGVDLVVQLYLPPDVESFLHRSGRTGRAERKGTCITMYNPFNDDNRVRHIEKSTKILLKRVPPPGSEEIVTLALNGTLTKLAEITPDDSKIFKAASSKLLETMSPEDAVAALFALSTNASKIKTRSRVTGEAGKLTIAFDATTGALDVRSIQDAAVKALGPSMSRNFRVHIAKDQKSALADIVNPDSSVDYAQMIADVSDGKMIPARVETMPQLMGSERQFSNGKEYQRGGGYRGGDRNRSYDRNDRNSRSGGYSGGGERRSFDRHDKNLTPRGGYQSRDGNRDRQSGGSSFRDRQSGGSSFGNRQSGGSSYGDRQAGGSSFRDRQSGGYGRDRKPKEFDPREKKKYNNE